MKSEYNIIIVSIILLLSLAFPSCSSRHFANFGCFIITKKGPLELQKEKKSERKGTRGRQVSLFKFINSVGAGSPPKPGYKFNYDLIPRENKNSC